MGISRGYVIGSQDHPRSLMGIVKANVLIDEAEHVRLADFGLLAIISDTTNLVSSSSFGQGGTQRWMSPELFDPEKFGLKDSRPTKYSDHYALGMLIYEVLSGKVPFSQHPSSAVSARVLRGERPRRPQGAEGEWFMDDIWRISERCWAPKRDDRPSIEHVLQVLEEASMSWTPPSPRTVAGPETMDLPTRNLFDSNTEGSTESGVASPSQVVSPQPSWKPQLAGGPNENNI